MVKTLIRSVTLYCAEIRTMRKEDITRLEAFEMKVWRRMHEKISWTEHISNEVLILVEEERSLLTIIRTRQRNWMGHIMRGDSLQREIIEGRINRLPPSARASLLSSNLSTSLLLLKTCLFSWS